MRVLTPEPRLQAEVRSYNLRLTPQAVRTKGSVDEQAHRRAGSAGSSRIRPLVRDPGLATTGSPLGGSPRPTAAVSRLER
jgi:hypothetical protein